MAVVVSNCQKKDRVPMELEAIPAFGDYDITVFNQYFTETRIPIVQITDWSDQNACFIIRRIKYEIGKMVITIRNASMFGSQEGSTIEFVYT